MAMHAQCQQASCAMTIVTYEVGLDFDRALLYPTLLFVLHLQDSLHRYRYVRQQRGHVDSWLRRAALRESDAGYLLALLDCQIQRVWP